MAEHPALRYFARRDLLGDAASPISELCDPPQAHRILDRQQPDGRWRYPGGNPAIRSFADYDQLETYRQLAVLVHKYGLDRRHPAIQRAAAYLGSFQTDAGDYRGIYGRPYTPNCSADILAAFGTRTSPWPGATAPTRTRSNVLLPAPFDTVMPVRALNDDARDVAERLFFETVDRVHRAGEGAAYTGLKPAGRSEGPVIPLAEQAVETGSPEPVAAFLTTVLHDELERRLSLVNALAATSDRSVADGRQYVEAVLGFEVYSHHLFQALHASAHEEHAGATDEHDHDSHG